MAYGILPDLREFPDLGEGHGHGVEVGMAFSLDTKVVFPGEGYEVLTPVDEEIFRV